MFKHPYPGIAAVLLAIALYWNTAGHGYCLDDVSAIAKNKIVQSGDFGAIFGNEYRFGYSPEKPGMLYRPLTLSVLALEWKVAPDSPGFYHLVNILLYGVCAWLLWACWRRVLSGFPAWLAAAAVWLFVAHPAHTEVVANIKSLDEILSLTFATAALLWLWRFWKEDNRNWLFLSLACFAAALFSKESSIVWLAVFPLCGLFFSGEENSKVLKTSALHLIPAAVFLAARFVVLQKQPSQEVISVLDNPMVGASGFPEKTATAFMGCWLYLKTIFFPGTLLSDLSFAAVKPVGFGDWQSLAGFFGMAAIVFFAVRGFREKRLWAFAALFFLATFSLSSNLFFTIGTFYGERLLFTPVWAFCLAIALILWQLRESGKISPAVSNGVLAVLVLVFSWKTVCRNPDWEDSLTLCSADLPKAPESARLNFHLAIELAKKTNPKTGQSKSSADAAILKKVIEHCDKALAVYPNYYKVKEVRGLAYYDLGQPEKALPDLMEFFEKEPFNRQVAPKLARLWFENGNAAQAEIILKKSIESGGKTFDNYLYLGIVYANSNRFREAEQAFLLAQKLEPGNQMVRQYLQVCAENRGK